MVLAGVLNVLIAPWVILALATSMIRDAVAGVGDASGANTIFVATLATTFSVMVVMALPRLRAAQHDRFEITHRFCGWTALILMWINTLFVINGDRGHRSFGAAMLTAPAFWLVVASAGLAIWPWLLLRRDDLDSEGSPPEKPVRPGRTPRA